MLIPYTNVSNLTLLRSELVKTTATVEYWFVRQNSKQNGLHVEAIDAKEILPLDALEKNNKREKDWGG